MAEENAFGGRRVLVVEDDLLVVAELVETLHSMGAEVIGPVANIEKAIDRLDRVPGIAGAVLDVNVDGKLIFPVAEELERRNVPFVFSTGYDDSAVPAQYAGVQRFSKPADERRIASALLEIMGA